MAAGREQKGKEWLVEPTRVRPASRAGPSFRPGPVGNLQRYFLRDVWRTPPEELPPFRRALNRVARVGFLALRGFRGDGCMPRAAALTYISALSIVPLLALAFSMLKGLGLYASLKTNMIEPYLDSHLGGLTAGPEGISGPELRLTIQNVLEAVDATNSGGLGVLGLVIVLWAAMRLLGSVESAFNQIWGVARARSIVRRATDYLAIVIAVPLFSVVAIGVRTALMSTTAMAWLTDQVGPLVELGLRMVPFLSGWLVFSFVYLVMPNTRSSVVSAVLGGLVANVLWHLALLGHIRFQLGVANHNAIYAGFAAVPVFLIWLQVSWVIVLFGAELAFAHEHEPSYRGLALYEELGPRAREVLALRAAVRLTDVFLERGGAVSAAHLAGELGVQPHDVESVLRGLEDDGLVIAAEDQDEGGLGFALARDPGAVTLKDVTDALREGPVGSPSAGRSGADDALERLLARLDAEQAASAHNIDLRELARRVRRDAEAAPQGAEQPGVQPS